MTRLTLPDGAKQRLRWPLRWTRVGLVLERAWQASWPLFTILLVAIAFAGFDLLGWSGLRGAVTYSLCFAALVALAVAGRRFVWPDAASAVARVDETLPGRPIAALLDEQATGLDDVSATGLWNAHLARMQARISGVSAVPPDLRVASRDPFALRLIALTGAALAIGFGPWGWGSNPQVPAATSGSVTAASASWEGWIEPPRYTGQPSLYLADQPSGPLSIPTGSRLTLRAYGDLQDLAVFGSTIARQETDPTPESFQHEITRSGTLIVTGDTPARWTVTAVGDAPPVVRVDGPLTRQLGGDFSLNFVAADDYGITAGRAEMALALDRVDRRHGLLPDPETRDPLVVDLPLPYRGSRELVENLLEENQIEHPFAGLPVTLTLWVEDGAGQIGESAPLAIILPARRFFHPIAKAVIEQRRDILWNRTNARRVAQVLRAALNRPQDLALPEGVYLQLRNAIRRLEAGAAFSDIASGVPTDLRDEVAQALWDAAIELEDGQLADARARMQEAQRRLEQAMRDGATPEEMAQLMDEFRKAMRDYLDQLAQNPQSDPNQQGQQSENGVELSQSDLEDMLDRIEELMREGREAEAMQMLDQLRQMMENMRTAQSGQSSQPGENSRDGLQDTLRQQQGLSDQAFRDLQEQGQGSQSGEAEGNEGRNGGQGRGQSHDGTGGQQGQSGEGGGDEQQEGQGQGGGLSEQQRALREQLDNQRRNLPGVGDPSGQAARDALDNAGRAMGDAADALEEGDLDGALDRQAEAMESLREGIRRFDEAMENQQAQRDGQQGANPGEGQRTGQRDPLGRNPTGQGGATSTDNPLGNTEDVYRRAQELMQELRNRSGERERPELERDYLKRLLDQF